MLKSFKLLLALMVSLASSSGLAQPAYYTVTVVEDLSFGTFVKTDNTAATMTIDTANNISYSPNIVLFENGHRARVEVDGLAPGQEIDVDVSYVPGLSGPSAHTVRLTVDNVTVAPSTITAQSNGIAVFYVGARLHSDIKTPNGMIETHTGRISVTVTPVP